MHFSQLALGPSGDLPFVKHTNLSLVIDILYMKVVMETFAPNQIIRDMNLYLLDMSFVVKHFLSKFILNVELSKTRL